MGRDIDTNARPPNLGVDEVKREKRDRDVTALACEISSELEGWVCSQNSSLGSGISESSSVWDGLGVSCSSLRMSRVLGVGMSLNEGPTAQRVRRVGMALP